jgi:hypothetical protein
METNRELLAQWSALGTRVAITDGGAQNLRLRMNP